MTFDHRVLRQHVYSSSPRPPESVDAEWSRMLTKYKYLLTNYHFISPRAWLKYHPASTRISRSRVIFFSFLFCCFFSFNIDKFHFRSPRAWLKYHPASTRISRCIVISFSFSFSIFHFQSWQSIIFEHPAPRENISFDDPDSTRISRCIVIFLSSFILTCVLRIRFHLSSKHTSSYQAKRGAVKLSISRCITVPGDPPGGLQAPPEPPGTKNHTLSNNFNKEL